jgi:hypothetical protein
MARTTKEEYEKRIEACQTLMIRWRNAGRIRAELSKQFGVKPDTVAAWMTEVRKRWRKQAEEEAEAGFDARTAQRDGMRELLNDVIAQAMSKATIIKDAKGNPVLDAEMKPIVVQAPDLQRVLRAAQQLRDLDALDLPKDQVLRITGAVATTPLGSFTEGRSAVELTHFLEHGFWPPTPAPVLEAG